MEATCRPQPKAWIDPANQGAAAKLALEARLATRRDILAELGEDWRETFQQLHDEDEEAARQGIKLPEAGETKVSPREPRPTQQQNPLQGIPGA